MNRTAKTSWTTAAALALAFIATSPAFAQGGSKPEKETNCSDRIDEDGDSVTDCADSDCYADPACKSSGGLENSEAVCSDWIDNDGDGYTDCDDFDCQAKHIKACRGSWTGPVGAGETAAGAAPLPALGEGESLEDLIGRGGDADGERNDFVCADGIDNDGDGAVDCADVGCRFDPNVSVCRGTPGLRFSLAAHIQHSYEFETETWDTRVSRLQLRAFGPVPFLQDSFFLVSIRAEQAPRLTFAFFNMPLGGGHFLNINSGGGGLSNALVLSVSKHILLDPPFYLYSAFEQGNGAAAEVNGPVIPGLLDYRVFVAGGSGRFNGNIGGRFFPDGERNYTWGVGAQAAIYLMGRIDRWDTRYLYTEVPAALTLYAGVRYDQRAEERFPAANINLMGRWWRFLAVVEGYGKRELNFETWQVAWNAQLGFLVVPKLFLFAVDVGSFYATDFPDGVTLGPDLRRLVDEFQWRVAWHTYVWRNSGLITLLYTDRLVETAVGSETNRHSREVRVEAQVRF